MYTAFFCNPSRTNPFFPNTLCDATFGTYEEVRAILAEKSRTGFRAEVKALLTAHGADKLSAITDPEELAAIAKEAEVIGSA